MSVKGPMQYVVQVSYQFMGVCYRVLRVYVLVCIFFLLLFQGLCRFYYRVCVVSVT